MPGTMRGGHALKVPNENKYVIIGTYPTDNIWIYDSDKNSWETINKSDAYKNGWRCQGCFDQNGDLHIISGLTGKTNHNVYNWNSKTWSNKTMKDKGHLGGACVCGPDGKIYLFGGVDPANTNKCYNEMYIYDINEDKWSDGKSMPDFRVHFGYVNTGHEIIVLGGGTIYYNDDATQHDNIWSYSFEKEEWKICEEILPQKNREFACAYVRGNIHTICGTHTIARRHNEHYIIEGYELQSSVSKTLSSIKILVESKEEKEKKEKDEKDKQKKKKRRN